MFIITVGLLGVAALIPIGRISVVEASKTDRASACGRAAWRDMKVRGYLEPQNWINPLIHNQARARELWLDVDVVNNPNWLGAPLASWNSVCIDPHMLARAATLNNNSLPARAIFYPFELDNDPPFTLPGSAPFQPRIRGISDSELKQPRMMRITLDTIDPQLNDNPYWPLWDALADRLFTWQDDLLFDPPDDTTLRPQRVFSRDTGGNPLYGQFAGDYSWMVTITPVATDRMNPASGQFESDAPGLYTVSLVVFYKRDLVLPEQMLTDRGGVPPPERALYADLLTPTGLGGGSVLLRLPVTDAGIQSSAETNDMPDVRPGQWIMLSWWTPLEPPSPPFNPPTTSLPTNYRAMFKWYRVVAAGEPTLEPNPSTSADEWVRNVTLAGPDWRRTVQIPNPADPINDPPIEVTTIVDADDNTTTGAVTVHATLATGVVAVFQKTMTIDTWSGWASASP